MYIYIWKFYVKNSQQKKFEDLYDPNGVWASFFKNDSAYIKTELIHDLQNSDQYLTVDYWTTKEAYQLYLLNNKKAYNDIDLLCEKLTEKEEFIGEYQSID